MWQIGRVLPLLPYVKINFEGAFGQIWFKNVGNWPSLSNLTMVAHILFLEQPLVISSDKYSLRI